VQTHAHTHIRPARPDLQEERRRHGVKHVHAEAAVIHLEVAEEPVLRSDGLDRWEVVQGLGHRAMHATGRPCEGVDRRRLRGACELDAEGLLPHHVVRRCRTRLVAHDLMPVVLDPRLVRDGRPPPRTSLERVSNDLRVIAHEDEVAVAPLLPLRMLLLIVRHGGRRLAKLYVVQSADGWRELSQSSTARLSHTSKGSEMKMDKCDSNNKSSWAITWLRGKTPHQGSFLSTVVLNIRT
jgi:hypothetical protein